MANGLDWFFNLGNRVTKGDPKLLMDWNFYLLTIMFLAFFSILLSNLWDFYKFQKLANLGWAFVMLAILWFQYQALTQTYQTRKMYKNLKPEIVPSEKSMLDEFKEPDKEIEQPKEEVNKEKLNEETKETFDKELKGGKDAK